VTHGINVRLLVLGAVGRIGELLVAVELLGELASEGLLSGVRPVVDLAVLEAGERAVAAGVLKDRQKGGIEGEPDINVLKLQVKNT